VNAKVYDSMHLNAEDIKRKAEELKNEGK